MLYGIMEMTVAALCIFTVVSYSSNSEALDWITHNDFESYVIYWIAVWGVLHCIYVIRRWILICLWKYSNDPRMMHSKINCFSFSILNTFECIWFLYGNFFFYNGTIFTEEKRSRSGLWKIFIFILFYGYLALLFYILSVCGVLLILYTMWSQGYFDSKRIEQYHN